jgi:hypothetical protein
MTEQIKQFRDDEVVILKHFSKEKGEYVTNVFPKISGRLRLAHENNDGINIETSIYKYDENIAVVIATIKTMNGQFTGIGMSSVDRDQRIAPAILEMAETRAISRGLRWAGFGIDACSAEEISHLENGNGNDPNNKKPIGADTSYPDKENGSGPRNNERHIHVGFEHVDGLPNVYKPNFSVHDNVPTDNGNGNNGNGNGNRNRQLSHKQWSYIKSMGRKLGYDFRALTELCVSLFNVEIEGLNTSDASSFIDYLQSGKMIVKSVPAETHQ